jgi:CheY-like chemotaxis protein
MPPPKGAAVDEQEIFAPTPRGSAELSGPGTGLSADELEVLVLVDGRATVAQVARSTPGQSPEAVKEVLAKLLAGSFIVRASEVQSDAIDASEFFSVTAPPDFSNAAASASGAELAKGVSSLQDKGYYVRIARRPSERRKLPQERRPIVLLVDDDPHIAKLLHTCFKLEGFVPRTAMNREEIVAALRQPVAPDLVLLDVMLPDIDGFDVLGRLRQHPALKAVPVIMLTGKATREAVLKGLHGGADGYITKPFDMEVLMGAVKTVFGLPDKA